MCDNACVYVHIYLSICLSIHLPNLSIYLPNLSIYLPIYLSIYLSIYLPNLSIYLPNLSIYLFVYTCMPCPAEVPRLALEFSWGAYWTHNWLDGALPGFIRYPMRKSDSWVENTGPHWYMVYNGYIGFQMKGPYHGAFGCDLRVIALRHDWAQGCSRGSSSALRMGLGVVRSCPRTYPGAPCCDQNSAFRSSCKKEPSE